MLYSGHLSIAYTYSRNQLSPAMVKSLHFEPLCSGHLYIADTFSENQWCPLYRGSTVWKTHLYEWIFYVLHVWYSAIFLKRNGQHWDRKKSPLYWSVCSIEFTFYVKRYLKLRDKHITAHELAAGHRSLLGTSSCPRALIRLFAYEKNDK